ncbi:MAG: hypothetical protein AABX69_01650 [Nanoarchaeota archaeon]
MPNNSLLRYLNELRNELKLLVIVFAVVAAVVKIAYSKEGIVDVLRVSASLFWLFIVPGYFLTLYWKESLGFMERTVLGSVAAIAIVGITSYYLGLAGLKLQNQTILLPLAITAFSLAACLKSWERKNRRHQQQPGQQ